MNVQTAGTASRLVETVADLMSLYMQTGHLNNLSVFSDLCLSLAKGIDHAVANNEVPLRSHELPSLLKQVSKYRNDFFIQEASMMLLMYVKNACKVGWFRNEDVHDLLKLIQEDSTLQFPTNITKMLKYGVNLLQVIGQFNGHYIAAIGTMSLLPSLESPGIKDYSRAPSLACPDLEIVETSSRVSPNWPICNSWQVSNGVGDELVDIITPANGSRKSILQDNSDASQIYSKNQSIKS